MSTLGAWAPNEAEGGFSRKGGGWWTSVYPSRKPGVWSWGLWKETKKSSVTVAAGDERSCEEAKKAAEKAATSRGLRLAPDPVTPPLSRFEREFEP